MKSYLKVLQHYADFTGRASKNEFWTFLPFHLIFAGVFFFLDSLIGTARMLSVWGDFQLPAGVLFSFYIVGTLLPVHALIVRRLQDTGRSGWMYFVILIPIIGPLLLLALLLTPGHSGANLYGDPSENNIEYSQHAKQKSAAIVMAVASVCNMLLPVYQRIEFFAPHPFLFSRNLSDLLFTHSQLLPSVAILIAAILLGSSQKQIAGSAVNPQTASAGHAASKAVCWFNKKEQTAAIFLIITSVLWQFGKFVFSILDSAVIVKPMRTGNFILAINDMIETGSILLTIHTIFSSLFFVVPTALLFFSGALFSRKQTLLKRATKVLFCASIFWMSSIIYSHLIFSYRISYAHLSDAAKWGNVWSFGLSILFPLALLVLAYAFLSRKEKQAQVA
ncbi:MAG: DUF805 domain-containing protein [Puniceicoccales bacterium]|jgi:uncharacterized membrane protein YhaH (DUF805 family)|nr:DUF805 domain-containing protein [Puniceicoccales bacterium]